MYFYRGPIAFLLTTLLHIYLAIIIKYAFHMLIHPKMEYFKAFDESLVNLTFVTYLIAE
jgi:hypothetical protein